MKLLKVFLKGFFGVVHFPHEDTIECLGTFVGWLTMYAIGVFIMVGILTLILK